MGVRMGQALGLAMLLAGACAVRAAPLVLVAVPRDYPHPDYMPTAGYLSSDPGSDRALIWFRGTQQGVTERHPDVRSWAFELPEEVALDRDTGHLYYRTRDGTHRRLARARVDAFRPPGAAFWSEAGVEIRVGQAWQVELCFDPERLPLVEAVD